MNNIIIVENEDTLRDEVVTALMCEAYSVRGVASRGELYKSILDSPVEIVIIDADINGVRGADIVMELRGMNRTSGVGIIMFAAAGCKEDCVKGLKSGADACLVKPVDLVELSAQIQSLCRRLGAQAPASVATLWRYRLNERLLVTPSGVEIELTHLESRFIRHLAARPGEPFRRRDIIAKGLEMNPDEYDERRLEAMVSRLRRKIQQHCPVRQPVKVAYSLGYLFADPIELE